MLHFAAAFFLLGSANQNVQTEVDAQLHQIPSSLIDTQELTWSEYELQELEESSDDILFGDILAEEDTGEVETQE